MQIESLRADGVAGTSDLNRNKVISDGPVWPIQYLLIQVLFGGLPNPISLLLYWFLWKEPVLNLHHPLHLLVGNVTSNALGGGVGEDVRGKTGGLTWLHRTFQRGFNAFHRMEMPRVELFQNALARCMPQTELSDKLGSITSTSIQCSINPWTIWEKPFGKRL